jgi:hypothetical protein
MNNVAHVIFDLQILEDGEKEVFVGETGVELFNLPGDGFKLPPRKVGKEDWEIQLHVNILDGLDFGGVVRAHALLQSQPKEMSPNFETWGCWELTTILMTYDMWMMNEYGEERRGVRGFPMSLNFFSPSRSEWFLNYLESFSLSRVAPLQGVD